MTTFKKEICIYYFKIVLLPNHAKGCIQFTADMDNCIVHNDDKRKKQDQPHNDFTRHIK